MCNRHVELKILYKIHDINYKLGHDINLVAVVITGTASTLMTR